MDLAAIDMTTGQGIPSWTTRLRSAGARPQVQSLAVSSDGSTLYVGGHFDTVNGVARNNFVAFDIATGVLDQSIDPKFSQPVLTLLAEPSILYAGGAFTKVDESPRAHLAALNLDGSLNASWLPSANSAVRTLALSNDGTASSSAATSRPWTVSGGSPSPRWTRQPAPLTRGPSRPA